MSRRLFTAEAICLFPKFKNSLINGQISYSFWPDLVLLKLLGEYFLVGVAFLIATPRSSK